MYCYKSFSDQHVMRSPSCIHTKSEGVFSVHDAVGAHRVCLLDARRKIPKVICPLFRRYSARARSVFPLQPPLAGSTSTMEHRAQGPTTSKVTVVGVTTLSGSSRVPFDVNCRLVQLSSKCVAPPGIVVVWCSRPIISVAADVVVRLTTRLGRN